jgi:hypothetical protein
MQSNPAPRFEVEAGTRTVNKGLGIRDSGFGLLEIVVATRYKINQRCPGDSNSMSRSDPYVLKR